MRSFVERFTSRKFLVSLIPIFAGLFMAFGVDGDELVDIVTKVAGLVTTLGGVLSFTIPEAKIDAASVKALEEVEFVEVTEDD